MSTYDNPARSVSGAKANSTPTTFTQLARPRGAVRWTIAVLLFIGVVINYFDRVNLSVADKPLQAAFRLSAVQYWDHPVVIPVVLCVDADSHWPVAR